VRALERAAGIAQVELEDVVAEHGGHDVVALTPRHAKVMRRRASVTHCSEATEPAEVVDSEEQRLAWVRSSEPPIRPTRERPAGAPHWDGRWFGT
jgi:hypothetical protein